MMLYSDEAGRERPDPERLSVSLDIDIPDLPTPCGFCRDLLNDHLWPQYDGSQDIGPCRKCGCVGYVDLSSPPVHGIAV